MEEITENILIDNGFKNDDPDIFSYIGEDYSIDIYYTIPIKDRSWYCVIYTNSIRYVLASMAIQTIKQFNHLMNMVEINFKLENYERRAKDIHSRKSKKRG